MSTLSDEENFLAILGEVEKMRKNTLIDMLANQTEKIEDTINFMIENSDLIRERPHQGRVAHVSDKKSRKKFPLVLVLTKKGESQLKDFPKEKFLESKELIEELAF